MITHNIPLFYGRQKYNIHYASRSRQLAEIPVPQKDAHGPKFDQAIDVQL